MSVAEIIDRERKIWMGFPDTQRCTITFGDFRRLLMEIADAALRERQFWFDRVKSAMEVADGFKATLDKVLDTLMFAQHMKDETGKRKDGKDV